MYRYWLTTAPRDLDIAATDTAEYVTACSRLCIVHDELAVEQVRVWRAGGHLAVKVDA